MSGWIIPYRTPFFLPWLYPSLTWRIPDVSNTIYLTFDDGPISGITEFVLETLEMNAARATFFCIGDNIVKNPDIFNKILMQDHGIGNHTFNHLNGWRTSNDLYKNNIEMCSKEIQKYTPNKQGQKMLFRPPYGKIKRQQIRDLTDYTIVMWDVLSFDFDKNTSRDACLNNTIRSIRAGSIVVFHDSHKAEKNLVYVLPRIINHFSAMGFSFKSIPA